MVALQQTNEQPATKAKSVEDYPLILTAKHIAEILSVSKPTVYEWMKHEDFPVLPIPGRIRRVHRDEFFDWLINRNRKTETA